MKLRVGIGVSLLLTIGILTGCSAVSGENTPYTKERIDALYTAIEEEGRADFFARELCVIVPNNGNSPEPIVAEAAAVFGVDDLAVPYEKNIYKRLYPASITKVMTALVAIKYGDLDEMVTVGDEAIITESGATLCNIKPGDRLTLEQLLYGLMLPSGNDAGSAIAVALGGSEEGFMEMMNREAQQIGATDTHFLNAHGLHDENHYTTAYDLYLIFREALTYPEFRDLIGTSEYTATYVAADGKETSQTWKNSNKYLTGEQETPTGLTVLGGKTGTTKAAGYCLIIASEDPGGNEYISVVLKSDSRGNLYENMTNIIQKIVN